LGRQAAHSDAAVLETDLLAREPGLLILDGIIVPKDAVPFLT
jgi:hypothetical protein